MRIIIEICNKFSEITFLLFAYISLCWVQCSDPSCSFSISKVLPHIEIPHDPDAHEIPVLCP